MMESTSVETKQPAVLGNKPHNTNTNVPQVEGVGGAVNLDKVQEETKVKPFCACGCEKRLTSSNPKRIFLQGHDAIAKKVIRLVADGVESPRTIHRHTVEARRNIQFAKKYSELGRALEEAAKAYGMK